MVSRRIRRFLFGCVCLLAGAAELAYAQDGATAGVGQFGASIRPFEREAVGQVIASVEVELSRSSGDEERDSTALSEALSVAGALVGRSYRPALVDSVLAPLGRRRHDSRCNPPA